MVGETQLAILVGSGNLTQSGFMDNTELFEVLELQGQGSGRPLGESVSRFVAGLRRLWRDIPRRSLLVVDTLAEIEEKVSVITGGLKNDPLGDVRLLTSFDGSFLDRFREIGPGGALHIASPYFGGSVAGVTALQAALKPRSTRVFPAVHSDDTVDVPLAKLQSMAKTTVHSLALAAKNSGFAHLKLYGFENPNGQCWLFSGSVNCTTAALEGANVEAGLLRRVPKSVLASYFAADRRIALSTKLRQDRQEDVSQWITFHATDVGDAIEVIVPPGMHSRLPLADVHLDLCIGAMKLSASSATLFSQGRVAHLSWSLFSQGRRIPQATRVLHLRAKDCRGEPVSGSAFVDDLAALSAEPTHRNAWRAALALLSAESLPEYSDIAALFSLVDEVVSAEETDDEPSDSGKRTSPEGSTRVALRDKAVLWPPRSMDADFSLLSGGRRGHGDLYWFIPWTIRLSSPTNHS